MTAAAVFEGRDGLRAEARGYGESLLGEAGPGPEVTQELGDSGGWSRHLLAGVVVSVAGFEDGGDCGFHPEGEGADLGGCFFA